mmetsp:Transcript_29245/g.62837  ORF Transcript_29245/g.62837 Transcript_29245/m.62837 type:complete len:416 (-) Transcript_29245:1238-2485(-)
MRARMRVRVSKDEACSRRVCAATRAWQRARGSTGLCLLGPRLLFGLLGLLLLLGLDLGELRLERALLLDFRKLLLVSRHAEQVVCAAVLDLPLHLLQLGQLRGAAPPRRLGLTCCSLELGLELGLARLALAPLLFEDLGHDLVAERVLLDHTAAASERCAVHTLLQRRQRLHRIGTHPAGGDAAAKGAERLSIEGTDGPRPAQLGGRKHHHGWQVHLRELEVCGEARVARGVEPRDGERPAGSLLPQLGEHLQVRLLVGVVGRAVEQRDCAQPALVGALRLEVVGGELGQRAQVLGGHRLGLLLRSLPRLALGPGRVVLSAELRLALLEEAGNEVRQVAEGELAVHLRHELHALQLHLLGALLSGRGEHDHHRGALLHVEAGHHRGRHHRECELALELHRERAEHGRDVGLVREE